MNKYRKPIKKLRIDNRIILNTKNIITKKNSKGLNYKNLELFIIKYVINNIVYKLDLDYIIIFIFSVFYL